MFQFRTNMNVLFESRISRYRLWKVLNHLYWLDLTLPNGAIIPGKHGETNITNGQVILRIPGWDNGGCWGRAVHGATYQNGSISSDLWELFFVLPEIWKHEIHFWFLLFCDAIDSHCVYCIYHVIKIYKKHNLLITDTFLWLGVLNLAGSDHLTGDAAGTMHQSNPK